MLFYHGTNMLIGQIDLNKCRPRTDFGKGFYLTDKVRTAQNWAIRKSELLGGTPTVLSYTIDKLANGLSGKRFSDTPDFEWLSFICENRRRNEPNVIEHEPRHNFHWVFGPIADDRVFDVVDMFREGDISAEDAIRRIRLLPSTLQLSLHKEDAIKHVDDTNVLYRQFVDGTWTKDWVRR